jgi:2'-5' RNA ligase
MSSPAEPERPATRRLFLALWPDEQVRARLAAARDTAAGLCRGKAVDARNLHITLAFLGTVDAAKQHCAAAAAARCAGAPFTLLLDRLGHWPRPQVAWVGGGSTPDALNHVVASLRRELEACGIDLDDRPFRPHVTLLRKVHGRPVFPPRLTAAVEWPVVDIHLVESVTHREGAAYRVIETWPLRG